MTVVQIIMFKHFMDTFYKNHLTKDKSIIYLRDPFPKDFSY